MDLGKVASHSPSRITDAERQAAVLAPVIERDRGAHILFTKRADHLGQHAGQMSFPGGGREPSDGSLFETAVREANEEVGMADHEVERVGQLDDIRTMSGYSVTPFVVRAPDRRYDPDDREVAEIAVLSLSDLTDHRNYEAELRRHPDRGETIVHFFHVDGYTVWGATARILVQLLELATGWRPPDRIDRVLDPGKQPRGRGER